MPDVFGPRIALSGFRGGILLISLLIGTLSPRSAWTQQSLVENLFGNFSGSVTITQPLDRTTPGDLAQRLVFDSSSHALAPWASVGLRWHWASLSNWDAHAMGALGLRWRRRSMRMTLGVSQDAVYDGFVREDPSGVATDSSTQVGYAMQAVTDVSGSLYWHAGRLAVGGQTGWRLAGPARHQMWYSADLATSVTQGFALVLGVDGRQGLVYPSNPNRLTLGLRWQWAPPARRSRAAGPRATPPVSPSSLPIVGDRLAVHRIQDSVRIDFRLVSADASQVEARGDLTDWVAAPMERRPDGAWQLTLPASPGVHRLAVRVDGGDWLPPPGLPVGTDGYGGAVGLFSVEP